jgi:hypothetical protein
MIRIILLAVLLLPLPALAQNASQPPAAPQEAPSAATSSKLPLAAMRHRPPSEAEVQSREQARFGKAGDERRQTQEQEIDRLYQDVIRRSEAPPAERP